MRQRQSIREQISRGNAQITQIVALQLCRAQHNTVKIAEIQQRLASCREPAQRRMAVLEELSPRRGDRVL